MSLTILDAMEDRELFGAHFKRGAFGADSWANWKLCLKTFFALPMSAEERVLAEKFTGRADLPPAQPFTEGVFLVGRRGGKDRTASAIGVHQACFRDWSTVLSPGEVGTCLLLASDREQAQILYRYSLALLEGSPLLARMIVSKTKERIELDNHTAIEIGTSDNAAVRGRTLIACLCDEAAFWGGADAEILAAVRPGLATTGGPLICITTPYARKGAMYETFKTHFGKEGSPVLVWKASSREMNPSLSVFTVALARARDPIAARSEFDAAFREDIESFLSPELVEAVTIPGRKELPPQPGVTYSAFCDPSGGRSDSFVLGIAHADKQTGKGVLDVLIERQPPFSPESVVQEFAAVLKKYHLTSLTGDAYSGEWVVEAFSKCGVTYKTAEQTRSELFLELLPSITGCQVELLDLPRLAAQLVALERRTGRSGRDAIDHPPGQHDDVANAAAGALVAVLAKVEIRLGLLAVMKKIASGLFNPEQKPAPALQPKPEAAIAPATQGPNSTPPAIWSVQAPPCDRCKSSAVIQLGACWHCNQCGADRWISGPPEILLPNRRNQALFAAGRATQFNSASFQEALARTILGPK